MQESAKISKFKRDLVLKDIFSETTYVCVLEVEVSIIILSKLEVCIMILTSFKTGKEGVISLQPPQNKPLKRPPKLGLIFYLILVLKLLNRQNYS